MKYSLNLPSLSNLEKSYVNDVLEKNCLSTNGYHTKIFEEKFRNSLGKKFSLAAQRSEEIFFKTFKKIFFEICDFSILQGVVVFFLF